ncbi:hypothetical protein [Asticcacaulis solisilvae]|uniref:hypothetical protein n=1 Tax=Asticcacaulis solisilvae TaxID=1217274 RepID=UPI003FD79699
MEHNCYFCESVTGSAGRAFHAAWAVRHSEPASVVMRTGMAPAARSRTVPPSVCEDCNKGWMRDLDTSVEDVLTRLLTTGQLTVAEPEAELLSWWLLKTACTREAQLSLHDTPRDLVSAIRRRDALPNGFALFLGWFAKTAGRTTASHMDLWYDSADHHLVPRPGRQKFGAQYHNLFIGYARADESHPTFLHVPGIHVPVYARGARLRDYPEVMRTGMPPSLQPGLLTEFLARIGCDSRSH